MDALHRQGNSLLLKAMGGTFNAAVQVNSWAEMYVWY